MRTIHKYSIDCGAVMVRRGGVVLSVGAQYGELYVWMAVDATAEMVRRVFYIYGTGMALAVEARFVGTVRTDFGVWHVFDGGEDE